MGEAVSVLALAFQRTDFQAVHFWTRLVCGMKPGKSRQVDLSCLSIKLVEMTAEKYPRSKAAFTTQPFTYPTAGSDLPDVHEINQAVSILGVNLKWS